MSMLITVIVPVFAIILMGRLAILRKWLEPAALRGMNDFVFYAAMPALLFDSLVRAESLRMADATAVFFVVSLFIYALGMGLAAWLLRAPFAPAAVVGLNACFGNAVMMGIPIVVASFGVEALPSLLGIIALHSAIVLPLATVLIEFGAAGRGDARHVLRVTCLGLIRNPVILTMAFAFLWRAFSLPLPEMFHEFFRLLGSAGPPLALFCLGASLPPFSGVSVLKEALLACVLKLLLLPVLMGGAGVLLGLSGTPFKVAVLIAGMPTGANAFLLARRTATLMEASASTVVAATVLSLFTLSALLAWLQ